MEVTDLVVVGDVDGLIGRGAKDTGLPDRDELLSRHQREEWPFADVHHDWDLQGLPGRRTRGRRRRRAGDGGGSAAAAPATDAGHDKQQPPQTIPATTPKPHQGYVMRKACTALF